MKPIPRKFLIHSVKHKTGQSEDAWGHVAWANTTAVSFVRIEPASKLALNKDNQEVQLSLLMFHDSVNSSPKNEIYSLGDAIVFNGAEYKIEAIDTLYDIGQRAHHLELGLI